MRLSRTTSDFLVASRTIGPRWNAAAISAVVSPPIARSVIAIALVRESAG